jgi:hypothetical protein
MGRQMWLLVGMCVAARFYVLHSTAKKYTVRLYMFSREIGMCRAYVLCVAVLALQGVCSADFV